MPKLTFLTFAVVSILAFQACSEHELVADQREGPAATPSKSITAADVAKLRWIEGTWRGTDGDKAFFERYRFENGTTMVVDTFSDETLANVADTSRFELKDGMFGHAEGERRSAASWISESGVQFVPAAGGGNNFRFERQPNGKWRAVLEWPASGGKPAGQKVYRMEPWAPVK